MSASLLDHEQLYQDRILFPIIAFFPMGSSYYAPDIRTLGGRNKYKGDLKNSLVLFNSDMEYLGYKLACHSRSIQMDHLYILLRKSL